MPDTSSALLELPQRRGSQTGLSNADKCHGNGIEAEQGKGYPLVTGDSSPGKLL